MGWKAVGSKLFDFAKSVEVEWAHKEDDSDKKQAELFG
jgi:hypothetical protein